MGMGMREGEGAKEWVGSVCGLLMKVGVARKGQRDIVSDANMKEQSRDGSNCR